MRPRKIVVAGTAVLLRLASGTAFAYFTSSGAGAATASTAAMATVTVAATAGTPSTPLYPGGTGDVTLRVTNPNAYTVTLISVTAATGSISASNSCAPTGVTFTAQTGLTISIAASGTTQVDLPAAASMSAAAANSCQGATFSIPVTVTVRK
jgi:hypothetical protein